MINTYYIYYIHYIKIIYAEPAQSSQYVVRLSAPARLALQRNAQLQTKKMSFSLRKISVKGRRDIGWE